MVADILLSAKKLAAKTLERLRVFVRLSLPQSVLQVLYIPNCNDHYQILKNDLHTLKLNKDDTNHELLY